MHAPLNTTDKQLGQSHHSSGISLLADLLACADFIRALEECHAKGFVKLTGGCNQVKKDLSMCLRKEVSPIRLANSKMSETTDPTGGDDADRRIEDRSDHSESG